MDNTSAQGFLGYQVKVVDLGWGKCSCFGGPNDKGVGPDEDLALFDRQTASGVEGTGLFLAPVRIDKGIARQLNPSAYYCAMRWDYGSTPAHSLRRSVVMVTSKGGRVVWVRPVDWGPNAKTDRVVDLSPAAIVSLKVGTDDLVKCTLFLTA